MRRCASFIILVTLAVVLLSSCDSKNESGDHAAMKGIRLYENGKYSESAQALELALQKGVSVVEIELVYTVLGNTYNELYEFEKAIDAHKKAIEINPEYHKAWVNLGIVYRLTGDFDEAEKCYIRALELQPDYAELHASIGSLYIFQEKYDQAVEHLEKATVLDNQLPVAWSNLALAYATVGRFDDADAALKKAVILGYENGPIIQERINSLKALEGAAPRIIH